MVTEKRLIDANALIEEINQQRRASRTSFPRRSYVVGDVLTSIYNAPAVDAVEVVRCKDCKHWFAEDPERCVKMCASPYGWCCRTRSIYDADYTDITQDDDFCSYGERRK